MNKITKYFLYAIIVLFVIIQFIPVDRENPAVNAEAEVKAPIEVKTILKNSCYDCHSNQTNWPFYSYIAPFSWLVARDVNNGREDLNFSEWNNLSIEKIKKIKEEMVEEISEGKMPLPIYVFIHSESTLNDEQKLIIKKWAGTNIDQNE